MAIPTAGIYVRAFVMHTQVRHCLCLLIPLLVSSVHSSGGGGRYEKAPVALNESGCWLVSSLVGRSLPVHEIFSGRVFQQHLHETCLLVRKRNFMLEVERFCGSELGVHFSNSICFERSSLRFRETGDCK